LAGHVGWVEALPNQNEPTNNMADAPLALLAIDNSGVLNSGRSEPEKVVVVTEDHSTYSQAMRELILVDGTQETNLGRRRHVDPAAAKACGDGV
jgi:hypothetical protein